jgi:hypothetical protein
MDLWSALSGLWKKPEDPSPASDVQAAASGLGLSDATLNTKPFDFSSLPKSAPEISLPGHGGAFRSQLESNPAGYGNTPPAPTQPQITYDEYGQPHDATGKKIEFQDPTLGESLLNIATSPAKLAVGAVTEPLHAASRLPNELNLTGVPELDKQAHQDALTLLFTVTGGNAFNPARMAETTAAREVAAPRVPELLADQGKANPIGATVAGAFQRQVDPLGYFSKLDEVLGGLRPTDTVTADTLQKRGVKMSELQARGLSEHLADGRGAKVSDLQATASSNPVTLKESTYADIPPYSVVLDNGKVVHTTSDPRNAKAVAAQFPGSRVDEAPISALGDAKWEQYSLDPGNPSYKETVLHLPTAMQNYDQYLATLKSKYGIKPGEGWGSRVSPNERGQLERLQALAGDDGANAFKSGHWSEPNVVAHMRSQLLKDAQGRNVFNLDELQSDWGQKLRDGGARDEAKIAALRQRATEHADAQDALREQGIDLKARVAESLGDHDSGTANYSGYLLGKAADKAVPPQLRQEIQEHFLAINNLKDAQRLTDAEIRTAEAVSPGHPLVNTTDQWTTTALRRAIKQAVDAGADAMSLTPGRVHADRFGLSKKISSLRYSPETGGLQYKDRGRGGSWYKMDNPANPSSGGFRPEELAGAVGKEVAEKLLAQPKQSMGGGSPYNSHVLDLPEGTELGGEGMKATYDSMYPRTLAKLLQKMDPSIKPEFRNLTNHEGLNIGDQFGQDLPFSTFPLTDKVKEAVRSGQALFSDTGKVNPIGGAFAGAMERAREMGFDPNKIWYHGSNRLDRLLEKAGLNPKRATSGPMPYFTDDPAIASSYATGKADTSLPDDVDMSSYFSTAPKNLGWQRSRSPVSVDQSWHFLSPEQRAEIAAKAHRVGYEDIGMGDGPLTLHPEGTEASLNGSHLNDLIRRNGGNVLKGLREMWLEGGSLYDDPSQMADIYKLAGYPHPISETGAPWYTAPGIMPALLRMDRPLTTSNFAEMSSLLPQLKAAVKGDRTRLKEFGADSWDKATRYTPRDWVDELENDVAKEANSHVWTSIPDKITAALKSFGYDGILDTGGKNGGQGHTVAVPFSPEQVRSPFAKFDLSKREKNGLLLSDTGKASPVGAAVSGAKTVDDLSKALSDKYGADVRLIDSRGDLHLDNLVVPKAQRGQGVGSQILADINAWADQNGKRVTLSPAVKSDYHGTTSRSRLVKFYKRNGFKENKGRSVDFALGGGKMYRDPKGGAFK